MLLKVITLKKTLSKAYYKQSIKRADIELLKVGLQKLYHRFNETESEEHLKNLLSDFLKETWYNSRFEINTKGRIDLAIHNGKTSKDSVGVIIEAKKPQSPERMTEDCLNCKALHELILYYFDERNNNNIQVKHLISTNINEWFIFDENEFDKTFYRNTNPRTFDIFNGPKIIIREITGKHPQSIIATYTEDIFLFNRSNIAINVKQNTNVSLKYVLGVLNSRLMSYYFMKNTAKSVRQMFPKLILEDLRKFPFKNCSIDKQQPIISIVEQVLIAKTNDNNAETSQLESQIDQLVYELYGLTEDEIKIVEGK